MYWAGSVLLASAKPIAHGDLRLVCGCSAMETQDRPFLALDGPVRLAGAALADQKFDKLTCWKGDILTVPCWKPLISSVRPFYCQCLSMEIACGVLDFIHLSATGVAEIAKCTNLKGCPHNFVHIVYLYLTSVMLHFIKTYQVLHIPKLWLSQSFTVRIWWEKADEIS